MKQNHNPTLFTAFALLAAFVIWTILLYTVNVQPLGPHGSCVGLATMNDWFRQQIGVNMVLYQITDLLSLIPLGFVAAFGLMGLLQWVRRKSIWKVDRSIFLLGIFYITVLACFVLFEKAAINYRPVLIDGKLEASYPSSTTMLVLCVMPTGIMQLRSRIRNRICRNMISCLLTGFTAFMVIGRILSGVHWFSDIVGGVLLSAGLVMLYHGVVCKIKE